MNPKIVLAFVAGAVLASGIVYYAARPEPVARPIVVSSAEQPAGPLLANPARPAIDFSAPAAVEQPSRTAEATSNKRTDHPRPPVAVNRKSAEKPSPSPPLKYREERQEVAKATTSPEPIVAQAPVPENPPVKPESRQPDPPAAEPPPSAPSESRADSTPPAAEPHSVTLTAGTTLQVRIGETLSTKKSQPGDTFLATLSQPLVIDGFVIAERGARAEGRVVEADQAGKIKGVPLLVVELTRFNSSDGQLVKVRTSAYNQEGKSPTARNAAKVGIGAALGAVIGAAAGGGKGAGIGAGVGGAAGAGDVLLTKGPDAEIPVETRVSFKIQEPVTITERLH